MSQIQVNHLTFYYEGSYENIFEDVSFAVDTDWKLGFIGRNGRGKTTFLKLSKKLTPPPYFAVLLMKLPLNVILYGVFL